MFDPPIVRVGLSRPVDGPGVLEALERCGLDGRLVDDGDGMAIEVSNGAAGHARLRDEVAHALEGWLTANRLPLVPSLVGPATYALRPPAA